MKSMVAVIKADDYSNVKGYIQKAFDLIGGAAKHIKKNQKVLLKPNLCDPVGPEKAATTHPLFVKAVVEIVKEAGAFPFIAETAAGKDIKRTKQAMQICGIEDIAEETGAKILDLNKFVEKRSPDFKIIDTIKIAPEIFDYDLIINLPKLKTHGITFITGAVKNCFGYVEPNDKVKLHRNYPVKQKFSEGLVDIFSVIKPGLTIMDAVIGMEGDEGPSYGPPKKIGYVLASDDAVAVDSVAAKITGHKPLAIQTTRIAHERGLGQGDFKKIKILGDKVEVIKDFKQHTLFSNKYKKQEGFGVKFILEPEISDKCTVCGVCFQSCPVSAIKKIKDKFKINTKKCIHCYCCLEVCTSEAVRLNKRKFYQHNSANIRLSLNCNQNCVFCTVANDNERTLTTYEVKREIRDLANNGVTLLCFTGGEPTIRKDLPEIFSFAKKHGMKRIELQTNGLAISDNDFLLNLKKNGMNLVLIALHSHKEEISNKLTQSKGFVKTVQAIKNSVRTDIKVLVSHVITSENYRDLLDFAMFIKSISPKIFIYFSFVRPNGNVEKNQWVVPRLSDIELYLYKVLDYCRKEGIKFEIEGMPLCYLSGFEEHSSETQRILKPGLAYVGSDESRHDDVHTFIWDKLKVKADCCKQCLLNTICAGVWKEYKEIFGTGELFPVFDNPDKILKKAKKIKKE